MDHARHRVGRGAVYLASENSYIPINNLNLIFLIPSVVRSPERDALRQRRDGVMEGGSAKSQEFILCKYKQVQNSKE